MNPRPTACHPRHAYLIALDDIRLAQHFHGIDALVVLLAHHHHLSEAALADHLQQREILDADPPLGSRGQRGSVSRLRF